MVEKRGKSAGFEIDSAGISGYHHGEKADQRMIRRAAMRGIDVTSISRPVTNDDLDYYDYIIGMDPNNIADLIARCKNDIQRSKITLMSDYCTQYNTRSIPDPYYGGDKDFDHVLDLLEDACANLLIHFPDFE